ncbi:MAG: iron ABC transporter permease [Acidobacteriota bacterium]
MTVLAPGLEVVGPGDESPRHRRVRQVFTVLPLALLVVIVLASCLGSLAGPAEVLSVLSEKLGLGTGAGLDEATRAIVWEVRLPRIALGLVVGAALGVGGTLMQGLLRNPLAEPGLVGVSTGAAVSAAAFLVLLRPWLNDVAPWLARIGLPLIAFLGALLTTHVTWKLSERSGLPSVPAVLLAGIAINALAGAATGILVLLAGEKLRDITFWTLGSLGGASWSLVGTVALFVVPCLLLALPLGTALNALSLGRAEAGHLGIDVRSASRRAVLLTALSVGVGVAACGVISFVGLAVPHVLRLIQGPDHRALLPAAALLGGIGLTLCDLVARTIAAPVEIPIGIITALLGAPFFLWIIRRGSSAAGGQW